MPGTQPAAAGPRRAEGSRASGGDGSVAGTAPRLARSPTSAGGDQLRPRIKHQGLLLLLTTYSRCKARLFLIRKRGCLCPSPISLPHVSTWTGSFPKKGSGKPGITFTSLLEEQGERGQEGTALCGFSDVSTANMQSPEDSVPQPTLHKLPCTEMHTLQSSLWRKKSLQKEAWVWLLHSFKRPL